SMLWCRRRRREQQTDFHRRLRLSTAQCNRADRIGTDDLADTDASHHTELHGVDDRSCADARRRDQHPERRPPLVRCRLTVLASARVPEPRHRPLRRGRQLSVLRTGSKSTKRKDLQLNLNRRTVLERTLGAGLAGTLLGGVGSFGLDLMAAGQAGATEVTGIALPKGVR